VSHTLQRLKSKAINIALDPNPLRSWTLKTVQKRGLGSYEWRVGLGAVERPAYAYCVREAASLANRLRIPRISVIEFGVAGGNGLVALERHAQRWSDALGIEIEVYGFDTGHGLPAPTDYRDLPYRWEAGFFEMDEEALRSRLRSATLVIGDVSDTLSSFVDVHDPAPIGAVMHDMDLYSSTSVGLRLFDVDEQYRLPRIFTYFDDIIGGGRGYALYNDYTGERLAINEFNESHQTKKIAKAYHLSSRALSMWQQQIYVTHDFAHSRYNDFVGDPVRHLPLSSAG
jgi:hypothetical protein